MSNVLKVKRWVKARQHPLARLAHAAYTGFRGFEIPVIPVLHGALYALHVGLSNGWGWMTRVFYWTPLFKTRIDGPARRLYVYGGMPLVTGSVRIRVGEACRISAHTTISGRWSGTRTPELDIGANVGIGWQTTIAVGSRVVLGDNVRIAGRALLAGYPGHPMDTRARAAGQPDTEDQIGDIVLEDDVWLGTGVTVSAGVRIGRGTVVAAGSVITRDLPANVLAGGVPARVLRPLTGEPDEAVT
jgi:acetyltransferase-like isoleucine patch superfamily enzyme